MSSLRNLSIRIKVGLHLLGIAFVLIGYLIATWWFLQQPEHHGPVQWWFFLFAALGGGGSIALLFILIDRHIVSPIARMAEEAKAVAGGEFESSITRTGYYDEIGVLGNELDNMRCQLMQALQDAIRFQHAVDHAGHAIYVTDPDGTIEYVNQTFEEVTNWPSEEVIGLNPSILQSGRQDAAYYERLWGTILAGDVWTEEDIINRKATGELFIASQTIAPIEEEGHITGFVAIMTDRTEEEIRTQLTQVLSRILRHNLRNELTLINGYSETLVQGTGPRSQYRALTDRIKQIERAIEKASQITKMIDEGNWTRSSGVCTAVQSATEMLGNRYSSVSFDLHLPAYEIDVPLDMELLLAELIENSIEHNDQPNPEVAIEVTRRDGHGINPQPWAVIRITDNGPGIPAAERAAIEQGRETPLLHASGIGLWTVYWLVTIAGGEITIKNLDSRGCLVELIIPRGSVMPIPRAETIESGPR